MSHEAVDLLSRYLQINSTNPPGNESEGVAFFADILDRERVAYKTYEPAAGRGSIRAVIPGTGEKGAVILLNHIDVVPVEADQWAFDPFGGEVKDGFIHGRGALDMKGQGIMELLAFLDIKRKGITPCRDLIFLAVADEEAGGEHGVAYLLEKHPDDFQAELVLNEGGYGVTDILPNRPVMMVSSAEKGICWVHLTRSGPPGHGSMPHGDNALEKLVQGLNRILDRPNPVIITDVIAEYFRQLGGDWDFLKPYVDTSDAEILKKVLIESGLSEMPQISAMLRNTLSVNMIRAGAKSNVIPGRAEADLDIRILPGVDPEHFTEELKQLAADEDIEFEVKSKYPATESAFDTAEFSLIEDVCTRNFPGCLVVPSLLFGASDSRFFRDRGVTAYGLCPVMASMEDIKMVHGHDERISEENMIKGTEVYTQIVKKLCDTE